VYNFLHDFGKRKHCLYEHPVEFSSKKLTRYRELCIDAKNVSKSFQNKCRSVLFWEKIQLRDRYDRRQRRVADKMCRFLISIQLCIILIFFLTIGHFFVFFRPNDPPTSIYHKMPQIIAHLFSHLFSHSRSCMVCQSVNIDKVNWHVTMMSLDKNRKAVNYSMILSHVV
jgi:hypothetical protein